MASAAARSPSRCRRRRTRMPLPVQRRGRPLTLARERLDFDANFLTDVTVSDLTVRADS